ncbi:L-galactono-1,4-lactone dehydrogenase 1, mitochondrial [Pycnococcus provasolii]
MSAPPRLLLAARWCRVVPSLYHAHAHAHAHSYSFVAASLAAAGITLGGVLKAEQAQDNTAGADFTHIVNWSATHDVQVPTNKYYQPETHDELVRIVAEADKSQTKLRPVGSALSPNGLALNGEGMLSMALLDNVVHVDQAKRQVTCQAGIRISELVEAIRPHGLTLQNYASIREQQVGGFTQVGAHGTGASIPPVDETVVSMKLVTPGEGVVTLSRDEDGSAFRLAKCGLGALGVLSEVTLQCVPAYRLVERTFVVPRSQLLAKDGKLHASLLNQYMHVRYMWIPFTDTVVVVGLNPEEEKETTATDSSSSSSSNSSMPMEERLVPLKHLLLRQPGARAADVDGRSFADLRDALLRRDPLNPEWVRKVNAAEAAFWARNEGVRRGWSDELLGFDCGGEQWVVEIAFPCGDSKVSDGGDLDVMRNLLAAIESSDNPVPAPAPIEQRWTSGSSAPMSPASGSASSLHTWIGIIMYLPPGPSAQRDAVTSRFAGYATMFGDLCQPYNGTVHWAKLELPGNDGTIYKNLKEMQQRLRRKYPMDEFNALRQRFDPNHVLSNEWVNGVFSK